MRKDSLPTGAVQDSRELGCASLTCSSFRILHASKTFCSLRRTNKNAPFGAVFCLCAGKDSNLRRPKPADLQSALVDHLSTDAIRMSFYPMRTVECTTTWAIL